MFCTNCGTKLTKEDLYCFECGIKNDFLDESQHNKHKTKLETNKRSIISQNSNQFFWIKPELVKTVIVGNEFRRSASSSVIRGAIGSVIGPIGLVGGLLSGKNRNKTTFLLIYNNGKKETRTVETNGKEFKYLVKYLSD